MTEYKDKPKEPKKEPYPTDLLKQILPAGSVIIEGGSIVYIPDKKPRK